MLVHADMLGKRLSCLSYVVMGAWVIGALVSCSLLDSVGTCYEAWLAAGTNAAAIINFIVWHTPQLDHCYVNMSQNTAVLYYLAGACFDGLYIS
jgi:hypothetical protein